MVSFFYLFSFLAHSQRPQIGCLPYFHTWCGLSANLECRSEMCCTRLAGNTGRKMMQKNRICAPSRNFVELYMCATKACIDNLLSSNISSTCPYNMANFGPLAAEIGSGVAAPQKISTGFECWLRHWSDVAHRRPTKLCTIFDRLLGWYTIYTFSGALAP